MSAPVDPKVEPQVPAADSGLKLAETETKLATNPAGGEAKDAAPVSFSADFLEDGITGQNSVKLWMMLTTINRP